MDLQSNDVTDPELFRLIKDEEQRQTDHIALIPSENYVSAAVLAASGSVLANKYSEGYPGKRYYEGNEVVDKIETLAMERAKALFGVDHVNVQPYSGSPANLAVYKAFLQPGDTVVGMALPDGGHLTHGWPASATGAWFNSIQYGVRRDTGRIDIDQVRDLARKHRPKLVFCGGTAIPRTIDFAAFGEIAHEIDAVLVADISHIAGLIVAEVHPSPVPYADVLMTTTHKTLRGPRGAILMSTAEHASALDKAVFPSLQGGPHNQTTAAMAVALHEASTPNFRAYGRAVVDNARVLAESLVQRGFDLVSGGTDNHLILIDLTSKDVSGRAAAVALGRAGLVTNRNAVPFDTRKPFDPSGLRIGSPAVTSRGMGPSEMQEIARWMDEGVTAAKAEDEGALVRILGEVMELTSRFPVPGLSQAAVLTSAP
jgi:glycine hydroxymethyltransferase